MSGRYVDHNSMADAEAKEAYIAHKKMLIGRALQMKLTEDKAERSKHQRADLIRVKEGNVNE